MHPLTILSLFFQSWRPCSVTAGIGRPSAPADLEVRDHLLVAAARMSGMFSRRGWSPTTMGAARRSWTTLALIAVVAVLSREGKSDYHEITPLSNAV